MKAYVLHGIDDLRYEERDDPECPAGWCVVRVKAAGICSSDIPRIYTKGTYHFPTIPGHEFAGVVECVANEEDAQWIGNRVGVFPLIPCRECIQCEAGHYEMCENYDYIGSRRDGAFAERVAVPIWNLIALPEEVSFRSAALMEPLAVALHAAKQGGIQNGDRVGVVGTGMIGLSVGQWAVRLGASQVTIIGRSEEKRRSVEQIKGLAYQTQDTVSEEYDVVIEAVGSAEAVDTAIRLTRAAGTLVLMGNPSGDITLSQDTYWRILRKQLRVVGTWNSEYAGGERSDWTETAEAIKNHDIEAETMISHCLPQERLEEGLRIMRAHQEPYLRMVTLWGENS